MSDTDILYATDLERLQSLLLAIDRPGSYCFHGRIHAPMPTVRVEGAGTLSFPVPAAQIRALLEASEPAPYGKGTETVLDTSVRNCRQIDAGRIRLGGGGWEGTLAGILDEVTAGIGCPTGRLEAELYKLLIYEPGGFFSEHRDTEKTDGMVATLSVTLPASGAGGELVVRHAGDETTIEMNAAEPSELAYAAFYADCAHEVLPLRHGHRLSLVFNLRVRPGDTETPRAAPDHREDVKTLGEALRAWSGGTEGPEKIVWVFEYDYTEAGLSFDTLKNNDRAIADVLAPAAEQSGCELHAAILHVWEEGIPDYEASYTPFWDYEEPSDDDLEMGEIIEASHTLDHWVAPDGARPRFGELPLEDGEVLPSGGLDGIEPDEHLVHEATGNAGVSIERTYRHAVLVVWPRRRILEMLAGHGIAGAVAWAARQIDRDTERASDLIPRLSDCWPARPDGNAHPRRADNGRPAMLRLLGRIGDPEPALRFLHEIVLPRYDGTENAGLERVLTMTGPGDGAAFLSGLVGSRIATNPGGILSLLRRMEKTEQPGWEEACREAVRAALLTGPEIQESGATTTPGGGVRSGPRRRMNARAAGDLFILASRFGLADEAERAAVSLSRDPGPITPERGLPSVLTTLSEEPGLAESTAYGILWRRAAEALLSRSGRPPEEPADWAIAAELRCGCAHCADLLAFCRDPAARVGRFPLRADLRSHLHGVIRRHKLDMTHVTERKGSPYTLVCTKNRASHERRLKEYAGDVEQMASLLERSPAAVAGTGTRRVRGKLQEAVAAAG